MMIEKTYVDAVATRS